MAREGVLDKGVERLPAHLRNTAIETLEGMEHIHVIVEAHPYGRRYALRLPLEEEAQALPFLRTRIFEDNEAERQCATSGRATESRRRRQMARGSASQLSTNG